ncbi:MAG: hypothetical protein FK733_10620, partial [Asgard group archaeon]|nr:hypothetical protein [Asgard group archaeon]
MNKIKTKRLLLLIITILCFSLLNSISTPEGVEVKADPEPVFIIDLLGPDTSPERNEWITLMASELPKIGIGIDAFDHTGWASIAPRTWSHLGPYPIPTYDEGGYDILFYGSNLDQNYIPDIFSLDNIVPYGTNFYQYDDTLFASKLYTFKSELIRSNQIQWAEDMQSILYDELPS